jgi:hypothetical protein
MRSGIAFSAGIIGGSVTSLILILARSLGMDVNFELLLGTMLGGEPSAARWIFGFVLHLMISGFIALIYASGFEHVTHQAGWRVGAAFALVHTLVGGIFLGLMPLLHPLVPEVLAAPGAFMSNFGLAGVISFAGLHVIYGALVGAMYGPVIHQRAGAWTRGALR